MQYNSYTSTVNASWTVINQSCTRQYLAGVSQWRNCSSRGDRDWPIDIGIPMKGCATYQVLQCLICIVFALESGQRNTYQGRSAAWPAARLAIRSTATILIVMIAGRMWNGFVAMRFGLAQVASFAKIGSHATARCPHSGQVWLSRMFWAGTGSRKRYWLVLPGTAIARSSAKTWIRNCRYSRFAKNVYVVSANDLALRKLILL